ncbi:MAG: AMP-binding protein [Desulfobacteraceae bacterium]|nr:AMP-binding protein [Desulfobacteraceae bacterium]
MLVNGFLENSAARRPDKVALICGPDRLTYRDLNAAADRLAAALVRRGTARHDRVIIFMDNSVEAVIALFGILKAGCAFIIVHAAMKARKLNYIIKDSGASALIAHSDKAGVVDAALIGCDGVRNLIWVPGDIQPTDPKYLESALCLSWAALLNKSESKLAERQSRNIDQDIAAIIYTSGSTGEPKGVVSAHCNMVAAVRSITTYLENIEEDVILNALPLSFDYGLYQVLMAVAFGGTVVLERSFSFPYKIMETLQRERVTGFPIVPTMIAMLLQMEDLSIFDLSSLRYISNTAAALPVAHIKKMQALFPQVKIFSMYGLTECKRVSYLPPEYLNTKPGSVGIPIPNEEVFIVDESGREVGTKEIGELVVRGANVMRGYWNAPQATEKVFRAGSRFGEVLLYTGDLFRRDEEGFLYFVARKDDMIKCRGERISPREIENIICELDGVAEAAVIGVPDEFLGNAIQAYVVKRKNAKITENDVIKFCSKNLEPFMVPKSVTFLEAFTKTPSGKIDKKQLRC